MRALFAIIWMSTPAAGDDWFDDNALPSVSVDDLERFCDPLLAMRHGANSSIVFAQLKALEERWWDMGNRRSEYQAELLKLRWAADCWSNLEAAANESSSDEARCARLMALRKLLGPSLYYAGRMPPHPGAYLIAIEAPPPRIIDD